MRESGRERVKGGGYKESKKEKESEEKKRRRQREQRDVKKLKENEREELESGKKKRIITLSLLSSVGLKA